LGANAEQPKKDLVSRPGGPERDTRLVPFLVLIGTKKGVEDDAKVLDYVHPIRIASGLDSHHVLCVSNVLCDAIFCTFIATLA
jgi:hypothetical protein